MKKTIILLIILLLAVSAHAQDTSRIDATIDDFNRNLESSTSEVNYTTWLNAAFIAAILLILWLIHGL